MTKVMDRTTSIAIALASGFPENAADSGIPTYGVYVVYNNSRYLLSVHRDPNVQIPMNPYYYVAVDISVYDSDGDLLTDATDVYLSAISDAVWDSAKAIAKGAGAIGTGVIEGGESLLTVMKFLGPLLVIGAAAWFMANFTGGYKGIVRGR